MGLSLMAGVHCWFKPGGRVPCWFKPGGRVPCWFKPDGRGTLLV